jgi:tellurium resistance protein TerD
MDLDNTSQNENPIKEDDIDYNLNKIDPTIRTLRIAAGWDLKEFDGENIDVDLSCFLLDKNDKTREDSDFIFYNNLQGAELAARHLGDNRTGFGERDDEAILIDLTALPFDIYRIVFSVSIYLADERNQDFTMVENSFVRIVNEETEKELARDDMAEKFAEATAVRFCELERQGSEWIFRKIHQHAEKGLKEIAEDYDLLITTIG